MIGNKGEAGRPTQPQEQLQAVESGDEAALSRLLELLPPGERRLLLSYRGLAPWEQAGVHGFIDGFSSPVVAPASTSEGRTPGFRIPVGQVHVRRRKPMDRATTNEHGDKSRR